jgi:hypothetical protein
VNHLNRKICVHAQTKDLWWKSFSTGKSPRKIKSYVMLHHMICELLSVLFKSLLCQTLRKISAMKNLSQYIIYNVKDINTAVDSTMCGYCYCSGVHDLHMYVSHVCSGCVMQCGILLVADVFYLHNKPLLCQANCTVYWLTSTHN